MQYSGLLETVDMTLSIITGTGAWKGQANLCV